MADVNIEAGAQKEGTRHLPHVYSMVHACGDTVIGTISTTVGLLYIKYEFVDSTTKKLCPVRSDVFIHGHFRGSFVHNSI